MEYNIRAYVDELFENAPKTQKAYELKIELTQNLIDKYYALVGEGKSQQDAYNLTVLSIGDVRELFEGLDDGNMPAAAPGPMRQDNATRRRAAITAIAIMMYVVSVVPVIVLGSIPGVGIFGVVIMFLLIAAATGLLVYTSMSKPRGDGAAPGTVVADFKEWQTKNTKRNQMLKAVRSAFWPLVVAFYFLLSFTTGAWHITWIIFLISPAVDAIIKAVFTLTDDGRK